MECDDSAENTEGEAKDGEGDEFGHVAICVK